MMISDIELSIYEKVKELELSRQDIKKFKYIESLIDQALYLLENEPDEFRKLLDEHEIGEKNLNSIYFSYQDLVVELED